MNKHPINPPKKGEEPVVITPAGPMPKSKVHPVGPGESIRRNPDGTYTVIPKKKPKDSEKEGDNG